jgi:hypothetical protein
MEKHSQIQGIPMPRSAEDVLTEIAESLQEAEVTLLVPGTWLVTIDDELAIAIELDDARDVLVLSADLGLPTPGNELPAYSLLLQASAAWRELGALRMAIDPDDWNALQFEDLPLAGLEPGQAPARVLRFADIARNGRSAIAESVLRPAQPPAARLADIDLA